ncbi:MAG: radical SAM protein [Leptospirales bacterium]|nr:radical SAM protein [Leptospirales bacterium]
MKTIDLNNIEPFEIASIRPPTENSSLSFRVTRSCYWNKCKFCPVYKTGRRFSKRPLEEIKTDISNAKQIDDLLHENGIGMPDYSEADYYRVSSLINEIKQSKNLSDKPETGIQDTDNDDMDERMKWFMSWFKDKPVLEESIYHIISWRIGGGKTCFLGDADSLILKPDFLHDITGHIKNNFPSLERFTIYGRTRTAAQVRSLDELKEFYNAGINRVHFGLESGSDNVLSLINKGVTAAQHIEGCLKVKGAGLSCSIYIMPGLGGSRYSQENAMETAKVINAIEPDFVRLRTLEIFPSTPLEAMRIDGSFIEASEEEVVQELKILVENIKCNTEILSDSASNLLDIYGSLPRDKEIMLRVIDSYLSFSPREKLEFSFNSRLRSFMGQYGSLSEDIYIQLSPFITGNSIDIHSMTDADIASIIKLIRSKLMP